MAAFGAYALWGVLPVYWKALDGVGALEILSHRILWSLVVIAGILGGTRRWAQAWEVFRRPRLAGPLVCSSLAIGVNWLLYIWAVNDGRILETSLGYFINPLVNVAFGMLFFRERLRPLQALAVVCALLGVGLEVLRYGSLPLVALGLALSFGLYGLLRKLAPVEALPGLFVETLYLVLPCLVYLVWLGVQGRGAFVLQAPGRDLLLAGTGLVTSVPLLLFGFGARRVPLITLGLIQYTAPSLAFVLGIWVYGETFSAGQMQTFGFVLGALGLYTADALRQTRRA